MVKVFVFVSLFTLSLTAWTKQPTRIVSVDAFDLSYTGGLLIRNDSARSNWSDRDETTFRFNLNYAQNLPEYVGLMWRARAYFNREDIEIGGGDVLYSSFGAVGGGIYNFDASDIKNSIFVGGGVGLERASLEEGRDDKSGFNLFLEAEAGKRWDLGRYSVVNISFAPSVALTVKRYGGGIREDYYTRGTEFKLNFLKFDILF